MRLLSIRRRPRRVLGLAAAFALAATALTVVAGPPVAGGATLPAGFSDRVVLSGLTNPMAVRFAADGRIFVAQKNGVIKVFSGFGDTAPRTFADLSAKVHDFWDRGLLGLALDPQFPARPYVYVMYAHDAAIGGVAPRWGDGCPTPPGATTDGCLVSGRISRLTASGDLMTGAEQVLVEDFCQQYPSHSVGTLLFGRDGKLYASAGDGASFGNVDYGQYGATYAGNAANPCGDPPGGVGVALTPPNAEGGALRSQSVRRTGGPATLDGTVLRLDPDTGAGLPDNPFGASADANARRILAYGLRNPFRMTQRPGTDELWVGDVGWNTWEEINRIPATTGTAARNFGWPCYEGAGAQGGYQGAGGLARCAGLYATPGSVNAPYYAYHHGACVVSYPGCRTGSSSITGLAFYAGGSYPAAYTGALVLADHSRNEIWAMMPGADGLPNPSNIQTLVGVDGGGAGAGHPVDVTTGPGGDLFYVDMEGGSVHRIVYTAANQPPTARMSVTPTTGDAPLTVQFDGRASTDPENGPLIWSWDLDGNGSFGDATGGTASWTYTAGGTYRPRLRVTDGAGATGEVSATVTVGNTAPVPVIDAPATSLTWRVGDAIAFSGHATDAQQGSLPAGALTWTVVMHHCITPADCHEHVVQTLGGVASGTFAAPDHPYPSWLELRLRATDAGGLSATSSVRLDPRTVNLTFQTKPGGLKLSNLTVNAAAQPTPFTTRVIVGSANSVSAPLTQTLNRSTYRFVSWSDGGAISHTVTAPAVPTTYTAAYRKQ